MIRPIVDSDIGLSPSEPVIVTTRTVRVPSVPIAPPVAYAPSLISEPLNSLITPEYAPQRAVAEPENITVNAPVVATINEPVPVNNVFNETTARRYQETIDKPARIETPVSTNPPPEPSAPNPTIVTRPEERRTVETSELSGRTIADKDIIHVDTGEPRTAQPNELGFGRTPDNNTVTQDASRNNTETSRQTSTPVLTEPSVGVGAGTSPWKIGAMAVAGAAGVGGGVIIEKLINNVKEKKIEKAKPVKKDNTVIYAGIGLVSLLILPKLLKIR